jgi:hypothetical protein
MGQDALETLHLRTPGKTLAGLLLLLVIVPVSIGLAGGISPPQILGFIVSILLLQGLAPAAGIGLGIPVPHLLLILTSVAAGVIIGIYEICDIFHERSERVARWIGKIEGVLDKYPFLKSYGEYMLVPIMWVPGIGLYGTPVIAWVFGWRGLRAVLLMLTGWLIACLSVLGMTKGVLGIFHL